MENKYIEVGIKDLKVSIHIEDVFYFIKKHFGIRSDLIVKNGKVGYMKDVGAHNSDYVFVKDKESQRFKDIIVYMKKLEEAVKGINQVI